MGETASTYLDVFSQGLCPSNFRIVLPTAPTCRVSCRDNKEMPSWFDIYPHSVSENEPGSDTRYSEADTEKSIELLNNIIEKEKLSLPGQDDGRIIIGGFLQGSLVALGTHLMKEGKQFGGVFALTGFKAGGTNFKDDNTYRTRSVPIL